MRRSLTAKNITLSETPDWRNLKALFENEAVVDMLKFGEKTEIGQRPETETHRADLWDIERLDRSGGVGEDAIEDDT